MAVVLFHYTTRYQQLFGHDGELPAGVPWGHYGVDLFFMLSGFVILMTLERTSECLRFVWGRFSRLYPTYWAAAGLTFAVVSIFGLPGEEVSLGDAILNLTMVQALLGASHIDGAYWSLQAELIFYVNMLLVFRLGGFRRPTVAIVAWVSTALVVQSSQIALQVNWPLAASLLGKLATVGSLRFIPLFGLGVLLYDLRRPTLLDRRNRDRAWSHLGIVSCLFAIGVSSGLTNFVVDASLITLLWMSVCRKLRFLTFKPLVWLGAISYSLYLTHQNIGYVAIRNLQSMGFSPTASIFAACVLALCLAAALHYAVERPTLQRLRRVDLRAMLQRANLGTLGPNV